MNIKGMLATKPVAAYQKEASDKTLKRALGTPSLIAFGIGGIIGTGIFVLTGLAAAQHAGPAIAISFIIAGLGCMFAGLCYSEFAAMVPVAGSAYAYSYATLGEFVAWFVGWNLILEYMMACSTVAVGWSRYFVKLLDIYHINLIPSSLSSAPFEAAEAGFQVHATGALLKRFGTGPAAGALPAVYVVGFAALAVATSLAAVMVFQVVQRWMNFAIANPARQVFFTVLDREEKYKAKNLIDVVIYRGSDALYGWVFDSLQGLGLKLGAIALCALPVVAGWLILSMALGRTQERRAGAAQEGCR